MTAVCRHCRRPIVRIPDGWLHTDGKPGCLDEWRWEPTGSVAEPEMPAVERATVPVRQDSYNDVRNVR